MKKSAVRFERGAAPSNRENRSAGRNQAKRKGELSELAFLYKAASLGFGVAKPYGDSERFDFILSSRHRLWRVQVKSSYTAGKRGYAIRACGTWHGGQEMYTPDEIDLLVVYLVPEDTWYVIPIEAIGKNYSLYFHSNGSQRGTHPYEKYREAWWLMKAKNRMGRVKSPR